MYSYEDRIRAVGLNIKLGKRVRPSIQQLGYPTMNTLKGWYKKYEQRLDLPVAYGVRAGQVTRAALVERRGVQLGRTDPRLICGGSVHRRASHSQLSKASIATPTARAGMRHTSGGLPRILITIANSTQKRSTRI